MPDNANDYTKSLEYLTVAEDKLFFAGNDGTGEALWVSNGSAVNRLFNPHEDAEEFQEVQNPVAVGDKVYFFSHPWDTVNNQFSPYSYLYISDGTESGTYQLWNSDLDENGYGAIEASNLPVAAAGDRLLFVAPDDPENGTLWWTVGTTSESFEPVIVDGNTIGSSFSDPDPISVSNGAWFTNAQSLFFTNGFNESAFAVPPEEVISFSDLAAINDRPWFSGRTSYSQDLGVWRVGEKIHIPDTVELSLPENNQLNVSLLPDFEWNSSENATYYHLQISTNAEFSELVIDSTEIDSTIFTISDSLDGETSYWWRVQGVNDDTSGEWSDSWNFTTQTQKDIPETVQLISPKNDSTIQHNEPPVLTWTRSESASEYMLQFAEDEEFEEIMIDTTLAASESGIEASDTTYTVHKELVGHDSYFWRIKSGNETGESVWSEVFMFTVSGGLSTENESTPTEFKLDQNYPNPFNPTTEIRYGIPQASHVKLEVFNMLGQKVVTLVNKQKSSGWHSTTFNASGLSSGLYIYRIQAGDFVSTKKLMLIK